MPTIIQNFIDGVGLVLIGFWSDVLCPLWDSLTGWVKGYLPFVGKFADFCFDLFRFRYKARIYSYAILLPIALIIVLITFLRKRRRRKRRERCSQKKIGTSQTGNSKA